METETILIGTQEWTNINLNVSIFRNGIDIYHATNDKDWEYAANHQWPAWCSYENNETLGDIFGNLYNFYAVTSINGLAPLGFNIPTMIDWTNLANHLGGIEIAGKYLKSTDLWEEDFNINSGIFNGFPGGLRYNNGHFDLANSNAFWWTASESDPTNSMGINLYYDDFLLLKRPYSKGNGFSVRCIKSNVPF